MRGTNVELDVDSLSGSVGLDLVGVVRILETLAEPDVALGGIVVGLCGGDLKFALDVTVVIALLVVVDLLTAGSLHGRSGHTCSRRSDETVTTNSGGHAGHNESRCSVLHFG